MVYFCLYNQLFCVDTKADYANMQHNYVNIY